MRTAGRVSVLAISLLVSSPWISAAQTASLTHQDIESFLLRAEIVASRSVPKGVTLAKRVTLSDGKMTHDAQVQAVDIEKAIYNLGPKHTEVNFKDSYRFNIAAYRLARLLALDNVPVSIERKVQHKPSAVTWWIDDVVMDEGDRLKKGITDPDRVRATGYYERLRVFDELIQNRDRNGGNIVWTRDWTMWMIDHTRAFRLGKTLLQPLTLVRCERELLEKMRGLSRAGLTATMGKVLKKDEIEALLARRDEIVRIFDQKIAQQGEAAVLYALR